MTLRVIEGEGIKVRQLSAYAVLSEGSKMARRSMRREALCWRGAVAAQSSKRLRRFYLKRAIEARDVSKMLYCEYQNALREELGW